MKAQIEIRTVLDSLILLRKMRQSYNMWATVKQTNLPKGFKVEDLDRTLAELEEINITAKEIYPQLRVT